MLSQQTTRNVMTKLQVESLKHCMEGKRLKPSRTQWLVILSTQELVDLLPISM